MGNDNVKYANANKMMKHTSPNLYEITKQLPNNKEVRIKKIYHVNRPDVEPPPPPPPPSLLVVKQPDPILVAKKIEPRYLVTQESPKTVIVESPPSIIVTPQNHATRQFLVTPSINSSRQLIVTPAQNHFVSMPPKEPIFTITE
jgi:hypothetical protein